MSPRFNSLASLIAQAVSHLRSQHCQPPSYSPQATVRSTMRCTKCGGTLPYLVSVTGKTSGRCSSAGCVRWNDL